MDDYSENNVIKYFEFVDKDHSGKINKEELQEALINGQGEHFSSDCCKLLIELFDREKTGFIGVDDFVHLYKYVNEWVTVFKTYDKNNSKGIEEDEMIQAFKTMGFKFSNEFARMLIDVNDPVNRRVITIDQFVVVCVKIQRLTDFFRVRDVNQNGEIRLSYEDFIKITLEILL